MVIKCRGCNVHTVVLLINTRVAIVSTVGSCLLQRVKEYDCLLREVGWLAVLVSTTTTVTLAEPKVFSGHYVAINFDRIN
jgi:hypothetical protein